MMVQVTTAAFVLIMAAAMWQDIRTNRIPNKLTLAGFVAALAFRALLGLGALGSGLAGAALALVLMLPLFALRAIGGGDAKLFVVVGAFLGPLGFLLALLASAVVGGLIGITAAMRRGVILPILIRCRDLLLHGATLGRAGERQTIDTPGALTIPYGAAIAIGSVAVWFIHSPLA
jgi:prepilin peptidase CpaA